MTDVIALATKVFLTLFVLLDPVGLAPLFLGLTPGTDARGTRPHRPAGRPRRRGPPPAFSVAGAWLLGTLGHNVRRVSHCRRRSCSSASRWTWSSPSSSGKPPRRRTRPGRRQDICIFPLAIPSDRGPRGPRQRHDPRRRGPEGPWGPARGPRRRDGWRSSRSTSRCASPRPSTRLLGQTGINVVTRVLGILSPPSPRSTSPTASGAFSGRAEASLAIASRFVPDENLPCPSGRSVPTASSSTPFDRPELALGADRLRDPS